MLELRVNKNKHLHFYGYSIFMLKNKWPTWCHLLYYITSYVLNMFRTLIHPSSGACNCAVELPYRSFCSRFLCVLEIWCGWVWVVSVLQASACNTDTTQQHSRKLLVMDILMSETCWVHKKWNKIASDIKLVFYSSTITMMHGLINIKFIFMSL